MMKIGKLSVLERGFDRRQKKRKTMDYQNSSLQRSQTINISISHLLMCMMISAKMKV